MINKKDCTRMSKLKTKKSGNEIKEFFRSIMQSIFFEILDAHNYNGNLPIKSFFLFKPFLTNDKLNTIPVKAFSFSYYASGRDYSMDK